MKYVIDSSSLINMKHMYPKIFPSLWSKMDELASAQEIISVKEVYNELIERGDFITKWVKKFNSIFETPESDEYEIIGKVLDKHKELIRKESITGGLPVADPFLISKAFHKKSIVVTDEKFILNAHKIPNICKEYGISYMNLEEFMSNEKWEF